MRIIKKQCFVKGAIILVTANAISKILGAVFKIPITYILKEEGMAIFNSTMQIYIMVLTLALSGAPIAISKLVAENTALERYSNVYKIVRVSEILMAILGIIGSAVLFIGAESFAEIVRDENTVLAIKAIAPSIFFVTLGLVYKGYYQGTQNMIPTAVSQVVEAVIKLVCGYGFAVWLINYAVGVTSAGAIFGITIGEVIATLILFLLYIPSKRDIKFIGRDIKNDESDFKILKNILMLALPLTLASGVGSVLSVVDISVIRTRLQQIRFDTVSAQNMISLYGTYTDVFDNIQQTLRLSENAASWLYGAYSGYALTIFHLPPGIVGALGVSILPVIAGAYAVKNWKKINVSIQLALRIAAIVALPCAVGMFVLAEPILHLLFKNTASAQMLRVISPCVLTVCVVTISSAVLQAMGKVIQPFINMLVGTAVKLVLMYILIVKPEINIIGVPIATNADYFAVAVLNLLAIKRITGAEYNLITIFIKPATATLIMGLVIWLLYEPLCFILMSEMYAALAVIAAGGVVYALSLIMTGAVSMRDINAIFKRIQ